MRRCHFIICILLWAIPLGAQVGSRSSSTAAPDSDARMLLPPPISGQVYSPQYRAEEISNYLRGRLRVDSAYIDNLYAGSGAKSVSETTISILPTIEYDRRSSLQHLSLTYRPGFTFYQPSSDLNEIDQSADLIFQRRLSPHTAIAVRDGFEDSSTSFGSGILATGLGIQGVPVNVTPGVTPPFAQRLTNVANAEFTVQTGRNTMIGAAGLVTLLQFPNPTVTTGLYDGNSRGGGGFLSHRIARNQYAGLIYRYMDMLTNASGTNGSDTQTQDVSVFYTIYLASEIPLSVVVGPQYYNVNQPPLANQNAWKPAFAGSIGWQGDYASYGVGYSQSVTGAGGLLGAFNSKTAIAALRWQVSPRWSAGVGGQYANNHSVNSSALSNIQNGHTLGGSLRLERTIGSQLGIGFQYDYLHASYSGIPSYLNNPDSNRGTVSLWWQFTRPLGR